MFGKNIPYTSQELRRSDGSLMVSEIWRTMQGEGPDAGRLAIFVRLTHCNLRCYFCDTDFDTGFWMRPDEIHAAIAREAQVVNVATPRLLVITGGEPLLQNIVPLVKWANSVGFAVTVETAGFIKHPIDDLESWFDPGRNIHGNAIICSPKTMRIADWLKPLIYAYKYVVRAGETGLNGLPVRSTQTLGVVHPAYCPPDFMPERIFIQPMDEGEDGQNKANLSAAVASVMEHGYRLSVQMHKLAGLP